MPRQKKVLLAIDHEGYVCKLKSGFGELAIDSVIVPAAAWKASFSTAMHLGMVVELQSNVRPPGIYSQYQFSSAKIAFLCTSDAQHESLSEHELGLISGLGALLITPSYPLVAVPGELVPWMLEGITSTGS